MFSWDILRSTACGAGAFLGGEVQGAADTAYPDRKALADWLGEDAGLAASLIVGGGEISAVASRISLAKTAQLGPLRGRYVAEVAGLAGRVPVLRAAGASSEQIARELHAARRSLGVTYKKITPLIPRLRIYVRNYRKYGDRLGPTIDHLVAKGKSWEDIIESASRAGGRDLGL